MHRTTKQVASIHTQQFYIDLRATHTELFVFYFLGYSEHFPNKPAGERSDKHVRRVSNRLLAPGLQLLLHGVIASGASQAGGALSQSGVHAPLLRSLCLDSQRVNAATQFLLQRLVD